MECAKVPSAGVRKVKKKQVKDELDRLKQAEKKKRRLEKALATSAAIRSELEKKKQQKKEEQQRLDEEGAAIAEAVALRVLHDEDNEQSWNPLFKKNKEFNPWDSCASSLDFFMAGERRQTLLPCHSLSGSPTEVNGWLNGHQYGCNDLNNTDWTVSYGPFIGDFSGSYFNEGSWEATDISADFNEGGWQATDISAELIAAQAVSSLQIAEDEHAGAFVFNKMLRG